MGVFLFPQSSILATAQSILVPFTKSLTTSFEHEVVIATKVFGPMHKGQNAFGLSRKAILTEVELDLYKIHD